MGAIDHRGRWGPVLPLWIPPPPLSLGNYLRTPFGWRRLDGWTANCNPSGSFRDDAVTDVLDEFGLQVGAVGFDTLWRAMRLATRHERTRRVVARVDYV